MVTAGGWSRLREEVVVEALSERRVKMGTDV